MKDTYHTIAEPCTGEFKDRGSKFIAYAYPAYMEEECQANLEAVKREHFKARHHCYAYRLGLDQYHFRANDDGEPSGTAGRPILGQIDSLGLTNVFIVVIRYFGGTKLGTSGLINAYRSSAAAVLQNARIIEKTVEDIYLLSFHYAHLSKVMNVVKRLDLEIVNQDFGSIGKLEVAIRQSEVDQSIDQIRAEVAETRVEELPAREVAIAGLEIKYLYTR